MALYRLLTNLALGEKRVIPKGSIRRLGMDQDTIANLEERGAVARINAPPLVEIPGWDKRAEKLLPNGIVDAEQFIEHDDAKLAKLLGIKEPVIVGLKKELLQWLQPAASGCC